MSQFKALPFLFYFLITYMVFFYSDVIILRHLRGHFQLCGQPGTPGAIAARLVTQGFRPGVGLARVMTSTVPLLRLTASRPVRSRCVQVRRRFFWNCGLGTCIRTRY